MISMDKREDNWMKKIISGIIFLLVLQMLVITSGCLEGQNKSVTMNAWEFWNDHSYSENNKTRIYKTFLVSVDAGDTVIIKDIIHNMSYRASEDYTLIECNSLLNQPSPFPIQGDITNEFTVGDKIMLTLTIIDVTIAKEMYNETWAWEMETIAEGWDNLNNTIKSIPQKYIQKMNT
jgi:hypothetical protein